MNGVCHELRLGALPALFEEQISAPSESKNERNDYEQYLEHKTREEVLLKRLRAMHGVERCAQKGGHYRYHGDAFWRSCVEP